MEYTWYVGGTNPQDVVADATTTTLTAAAATPGVTLTSVMTPATATGWVEFFDGATSLGHSEVSSGTAALTTTGGTPQWHAPGQVVFHLKSAATTTVPSDAFSFLDPFGKPVVIFNSKDGLPIPTASGWAPTRTETGLSPRPAPAGSPSPNPLR